MAAVTLAMPLRLEHLSYVLFIGGGIAALVGDRLSYPGVRDGGVVVALLAAAVFGLDMIVTRRAEIATRYSSTTSPRFHVFRGVAAVAWGLAFVLFAGALVAFGIARLTGSTAADELARDRPGLILTLAGAIVAALGVGSAGKATYRSGDSESPASRIGDRIYGAATAVFGLCLTGLGLLRLFSPASAQALKASAVEWILGLIPK
ncbi:MAG TPA: hypothetical protein VFV95_02720 [Vicinamibacterales bacterium]|nr:hypothetical protein [Vicinamibacterales bacterium]